MGELLNRLEVPPFAPLPPLWGGRRQTIAAYLIPPPKFSFNETFHNIQLEDGDQIVVVETKPENWQPNGPIAVLVHGLTGCHQSNYLVRLTKRLLSEGHLVLRVNLRGCGPGFGLAKQPYHSGRSEDVRQVLRWAAARHIDSPVDLLGFSLGANLSLKLAGEDATSPTGNLRSVIAVSPPLDLAACTHKMSAGSNRLFGYFFTRRLIAEVAKFESSYGELQPTFFPKNLSLKDFDDRYTAPKSGFKNALDYYHRCSSKNFVAKIELPTLVLYAYDDPVIDAAEFTKLPQKKCLDVVLTESGGHVGFLAKTSSGIHWMDELLVRWLKDKF